MPTGVECVQYSMELTPQLTSKELNANTAFTAVCVRDLVVIMSETGAVYKSGAYSLRQWVNGVCRLYGYSPNVRIIRVVSRPPLYAIMHLLSQEHSNNRHLCPSERHNCTLLRMKYVLYVKV